MSKLPKLDATVSSLILRKLRRVPPSPDLMARYEVRVWFSFQELAEVDREIRHTLALLSRARTPVSLVILIKQYVIAWATLRDVYANLLNVAFDLGIPEKHVKFEPVIQNSHVKKTGIPEVFQGKRKAIRADDFRNLRNDVVHRGRLSMPEIDALRVMESQFSFSRVFEGDSPLNSPKELGRAVQKAARAKTVELRAQYAATIKMLNQASEKVRDRVLSAA